MLDLRRLQYLDAVYRYRSFTKASEELYVSQPAISSAISAMEKELGVVFIIRNTKDITFTPAGEQLMVHAKKILQSCSQAEADLKEWSGIESRTMRLGISPTVGSSILKLVYSKLVLKWDSARIYLDEGSMLNHVEKIKNNLLDLSYNALPDFPEQYGLTTIPITSYEIRVLLKPNHPLAKLPRIPISALENEKLVMLDDKSRTYEAVVSEFIRLGIVPNIVSQHEQIICMLNMIQSDNYVGFIDNGYFPLDRHNFALVPFEQPIRFDVGFFMQERKSVSRIAADLIELTKKIIPAKT